MTRRLRRYFEAHLVKVITNQLIKQILSKTEASGKLAKYAMELGAYNITFEPRNLVNGQVLEDFISKTPDGEPSESYFWIPEVTLKENDVRRWTLFTDGASNTKGSGAGLVLIDSSGIEHTISLLAELRIANKMKIQDLEARVDSEPVVQRIENENPTRAQMDLGETFESIRAQGQAFESYSVQTEVLILQATWPTQVAPRGNPTQSRPDPTRYRPGQTTVLTTVDWWLTGGPAVVRWCSGGGSGDGKVERPRGTTQAVTRGTTNDWVSDLQVQYEVQIRQRVSPRYGSRGVQVSVLCQRLSQSGIRGAFSNAIIG
ncbi:hypothetical protein Tco_0145270 [Tanacetum coccineum]